ncbi:MAG: transcriptional regulator [Erythrobacter sp.]|nr:ChrR family anti-sigma-E factor [Silicimonas sp.]NNC59583.1 transcriptional regulator [Erythrobacter sp.]NNF92293.1 transcriptional regulator [Boseongicola sp.]
MNQIKHHLTDALLLSHAAGGLPEAFGVVVATHISLCDECRARSESFEAVGGALLSESGRADLSADCLDATMALIDAAPEIAAPSNDNPASAVLPAPVRHYVGGDVDAVRWRPVGAGVRQAVLKTSGKETVRLLAIPGGAAMPDHGHAGMELTLVLQGAFRDEDDRFARGDVEVANEDLQHTPVAEEGEMCICLAAADAPLRFKGIVPRIAQRFIGI